MAAENDLKTHFETLGLPDEAQTWLLDLWNVVQVLDDAYDGDAIEKSAAAGAVRAIFLTMPLNDFYRQNAAILQPALVLQMLKWEAANALEAAGQADERTYVARAGYYDVVMLAAHICGIDAGVFCLKLYGESFAEYIAEFGRAA